MGGLETNRKQKKTPLNERRFSEFGAGNETRTRDPDLGKVVLYQLSYSRKWRPLGDSNPCYRRERAVS
ncbi:hypothetical protein EMIT0P12_80071 [Pseudomonas sp. IT-P12]